MLHERDRELATLRDLLTAAVAGAGTVAVVDGPAGIGKTSLLRALRPAADVRVLAAAGAELERDFAFGVVGQLLGPLVRRGELELDPTVRAVLDGTAPPAPSHAILNRLFWTVAELGPLLIEIDDAQWIDEPSLRFLEFLARRIADLPVLLVLAARPWDGEVAFADRHRMALAPLSPDAVASVLADALGTTPEPGFVAAAAQTTGGNPMLLDELGRAMRADGVTGTDADAEAARTAVPGSLVRAVTARLTRQGEHAPAVAQALAILGDHTRIDRVARLSGLPLQAVEATVDTLVRAELLAPDGLSFLHPMVREAIRTPARGRLHRAAAMLLTADGERDEVIALHLLQAEPAGDEDAARVLRRAGERAQSEGAPALAARLLQRALDEGPADRLGTRLALGRAQAAIGQVESALEHLGAVAAEGAPELAAHAELARASLLNLLDRHLEAADGLTRARDALGDQDPDLALRLTEQLVETQSYVPELVPDRTAFLEALDPATAPAPLLAHLAFRRAVSGATRAEVADLGRRATSDGALLDDFSWGRSTPYWVSEALASVEAGDEHRRLMQAMTHAAARSGSEFAMVYVAVCRSHGEWRFGDLRRAEEEGRTALDAFRATGLELAIVYCVSIVAQARLDQGDVDGAVALIGELPERPPTDETGVYAIRARIRLAEGRPEDALRDLERQFDRERRWDWRLTPREHARATQVLALAALGRVDEAREVADATLALARPQRHDGESAMLLYARAHAELGSVALSTLEEAARLAAGSPLRTVHARVLAGYGAALRRAGRRTAAREVLAKARELAHACGAAGVEAVALQELRIAGARPKRVALSGRDALTAAELRAAELAAQGLTNRQIGETLYVTLKTVELHLGRAYAKLGINSRTQLADALE